MSQTMTMNTLQAVNAIGKYFAGIAPTVWALTDAGLVNTFWPAPSLYFAPAGAPTLTIRWDGATGASDEGLESVRVPKNLVFELRCIHPSYPSADGGFTDWFPEAQIETLTGASAIEEAIGDDVTLGNLVIRAHVLNMLTGPILDVNQTEFYGVQVNVNCQIH